MKKEDALNQLLIGGVFSITCLTYLTIPIIAYISEKHLGIHFNTALAPFFSLLFFGAIYYFSINKLKIISRISSQFLKTRYIVLLIFLESAFYILLSELIPIHEQYRFIFN